jgi:hypothetical protein
MMKELVRKILITPIVNRGMVRSCRYFRKAKFDWVMRLPVVGEVEFEDGLGGSLFMITDGLDSIASRIQWRGREGWEPEIVKILPELRVNRGIVLDVGANTGFFSLLLARFLGPDYVLCPQSGACTVERCQG